MLQDSLAGQQQQVQLLTSQMIGLQTSLTQQSNDHTLKQLREELGSLKGIMLSRHQFPPTPNRMGGANGSGIPQWQRTAVAPDGTTSTPIKMPLDPQGLDGAVKGDSSSGSEMPLQNGIGNELLDGSGTLPGNENPPLPNET